MISWQDDALILAARAHGENAAILQLLTKSHGRYAGLVPGGQSKTKRASLQPGNWVHADWSARLSEHLGRFKIETKHAYPSLFLDKPPQLLALSSACALMTQLLPERAPMAAIYDASLILFDQLNSDFWGESYVTWEIGLLSALGYGLSLDRCAVSGETDHLSYVSPKTGNAVTADSAQGWEDRLLKLPAFLAKGSSDGLTDVKDGLKLSGYFLGAGPLALLDKGLPEPRKRLAEYFEKRANA